MSEINEPKAVISDDEKKFIADELVEWYDYETELDDDEVYEVDLDEAHIVDAMLNNTYIDMGQLEADAEAMNLTTYRPAQVIRVLNKIARTLPSGQVVVDYELEIQDVAGATSYDVRVLQQEVSVA